MKPGIRKQANIHVSARQFSKRYVHKRRTAIANHDPCKRTSMSYAALQPPVARLLDVHPWTTQRCNLLLHGYAKRPTLIRPAFDYAIIT